MIKKVLKSIDYSLILIAFLLFGIGIVALYSANGGVHGNMEEVTKQLIWFAVGVVCMLVILLINYNILRQIVDADLYTYLAKFSGRVVYYSDIWGKELVSVW
jgi:cell division protein FtsW (lipid II flippase)